MNKLKQENTLEKLANAIICDKLDGVGPVDNRPFTD